MARTSQPGSPRTYTTVMHGAQVPDPSTRLRGPATARTSQCSPRSPILITHGSQVPITPTHPARSPGMARTSHGGTCSMLGSKPGRSLDRRWPISEMPQHCDTTKCLAGGGRG